MTYGSGNSGNYKKLKGQNIQVLDTDPVLYAGTWASGGDLNTARYQMGTFGKNQNANVVVGGISGDDDYTMHSETYNGTAWTEGNNANGIRKSPGGAGTTTAGIIFGGKDKCLVGYLVVLLKY